MEKRYDDILTARLEDAVHNGCTHITWAELYLWYDVQKIAAKTYRSLNRRLREISSDHNAKPMMVEGRGGIYVFVQKPKLIDPDAG